MCFPNSIKIFFICISIEVYFKCFFFLSGVSSTNQYQPVHWVHAEQPFHSHMHKNIYLMYCFHILCTSACMHSFLNIWWINLQVRWGINSTLIYFIFDSVRLEKDLHLCVARKSVAYTMFISCNHWYNNRGVGWR